MIWEGMVVGKDCTRKAREKTVDVTVGLTGSCVKKQGKKKPHYADRISKMGM